jgi:dienelactone hydrolase
MEQQIHHFRLISRNGVPLLFVFAGSREKAAAKGTVLLYHGLSSKKECNLKELKSIAENGFLAVGVDAVGHGQRLWPDFSERLNSCPEKTLAGIVHDTCHEIPALINELAAEHGIHTAKMAITGVSMGGYITFLSITLEKRLKAAMPILGSPFFPGRPELSPCLQPENFFPVALLIQNAAQDKSVNPGHARKFAVELQDLYRNQPEKLKYVEFPESGHFMQEHEWNSLWANCINWLHTFLI